MEVKELKFILKLLGKTDYRAPISQIKPNEKTKASERDKICRDLRERGLVEYHEELEKVRITSAGKHFLKLDLEKLPLTAQLGTEKLKILQACQGETMALSKIKIRPAKHRDELVKELIEKGLIIATQKKIKEVWLTEIGQEYLAKEYRPIGGNILSISQQMLGDYLHFLRQYFTPKDSNKKFEPTDRKTKQSLKKTTDEEILQIIKDLDREMGTNNYLPIYHLREKLQPPLSREELDQALYRLQEKEQIDFDSIVESVNYTQEQLEAGIPQEAGGALFFIILN